jgi:hypothetical protein
MLAVLLGALLTSTDRGPPNDMVIEQSAMRAVQYLSVLPFGEHHMSVNVHVDVAST